MIATAVETIRTKVTFGIISLVQRRLASLRHNLYAYPNVSKARAVRSGAVDVYRKCDDCHNPCDDAYWNPLKDHEGKYLRYHVS